MSIVQTKIVKKLASFGVRHTVPDSIRKLLLPLSFGCSSLSLLHVVDQYLQRQTLRTGRAGFELQVLHVRDLEQNCTDLTDAYLQQIRDLFPRHTYVVKSLTDEDFLLPSSNIPKETTRRDVSAPSEQLEGVSEYSAGLPSATSRLDLLEIARTRLIANEALSANCETVIWGHSTTRLAENILAETAKGRGFALPWLAHDGVSPFGVNFLFPMRELLKKEVRAFVHALPSKLGELCLDEPTGRIPFSKRATTIDDLMKEYFQSVEESYPSIVTNVMRTSSKLAIPPNDDTSPCGLCHMPVSIDALGLSEWAGTQEPSSEPAEIVNVGHICYGCATSMQDRNKLAR